VKRDTFKKHKNIFFPVAESFPLFRFAYSSWKALFLYHKKKQYSIKEIIWRHNWD